MLPGYMLINAELMIYAHFKICANTPQLYMLPGNSPHYHIDPNEATLLPEKKHSHDLRQKKKRKYGEKY